LGAGVKLVKRFFSQSASQPQSSLDPLTATKVLAWFYGDGVLGNIRDAGGMSPEAIRQTEDMLNKVISCSTQMGYAEALFRQSYKVPTDVVRAIKRLGTETAKTWQKSKLGKKQRVYQTCRDTVAQTHKGAVLGSLEIR